MASLRESIVESAAQVQAALGQRLYIAGARDVADRAVAGEVGFRHIGVDYIPVGRRNVDWAGRHRQHQEWRAQLNRFFHLSPLAQALDDTRDDQYALAARDHLVDWLDAHPHEPRWELQPYDNTLNLSIRVQQWLGTLPVFCGSERFDEALLARIVGSAAAQLDYLAGHVHAEGNWRIAHADALVMVGLRLAFVERSAHWVRAGVRIINEAFLRQVLPDGVHIERNPGYHGWMTSVFDRYWELGNARPELGLSIDAETVAKMHDYSLASMRPSGQCNCLHDSNGHATGKRGAGFGKAREEFRSRAGLPAGWPAAAQFFPAAGQALLRDGWGEGATYVTFDASTWGGSHCHLSRNAVQVHAFGRSILVDPGTLTYEVKDPLMASGKSTPAHNTLNLNGWNQSFTDPIGTRHESLPGYDLVESRYVGGFWPSVYHWWLDGGHGAGMWAEHHRAMLWVHGKGVVVLDLMHHTATEGNKPTLENNWQFSGGPVRVLEGDAGVVSQMPDANAVVLFPLRAPGSRIAVFEGSREPARGWLQGEKAYAPAPQVCVRAEKVDAWLTHLATVIVPFAGATAPRASARFVPCAVQGNGQPAGYLEVDWGDGTRERIDWTRRLEFSLGEREGLSTDASLVAQRFDASGRRVRTLVVSGTFVDGLETGRRAKLESFVVEG